MLIGANDTMRAMELREWRSNYSLVIKAVKRSNLGGHSDIYFGDKDQVKTFRLY